MAFFVSGVLFALRDTFQRSGRHRLPEIEVPYVEDGSTGQAIEIEAMVFPGAGRRQQGGEKPYDLADHPQPAPRGSQAPCATHLAQATQEDIGMSSIEGGPCKVEGLRWIGESRRLS
ncbi:MAG: hypothetical protein IPG33_10585 [Betaproteobacteria bacterium]|nr:hypothetical protein [Betaproteobacteria bacterium]